MNKHSFSPPEPAPTQALRTGIIFAIAHDLASRPLPGHRRKLEDPIPFDPAAFIDSLLD